MALLAHAVLGGCGGDRAIHLNDPAASVTDTLSVSIVQTIGAPVGSDQEVMGRTFSGFLREDRIFVSNGAVPEIREYDRSGRLIRRIGRRGRGPGEFTNLRHIAPLNPDSLIALDGLTSQVTVFDPEGSYVRSFRPRLPEHGQAEWISEYDTGFAIGFSHGLDPRRLSGITRDSFSIALFHRDPAPEDSAYRVLLSVGGRWWRPREAVGAYGLEMIVDGPRPSATIRDGRLLVSTSDAHAIRRWDGSAWSIVRLDGHDWSNGAVSKTPHVVVRLYDQLVAGANGQFWLSDFEVASDGFRTWRVFTPDGHLSSILRLPGEFMIWQVAEDLILGRRLTEAGYEYVELLQLIDHSGSQGGGT